MFVFWLAAIVAGKPLTVNLPGKEFFESVWGKLTAASSGGVSFLTWAIRKRTGGWAYLGSIIGLMVLLVGLVWIVLVEVNSGSTGTPTPTLKPCTTPKPTVQIGYGKTTVSPQGDARVTVTDHYPAVPRDKVCITSVTGTQYIQKFRYSPAGLTPTLAEHQMGNVSPALQGKVADCYCQDNSRRCETLECTANGWIEP